MALSVILLTKLAILAAPIVIKEYNKLSYISKKEKQIKELQKEIDSKKFDIGNYCYEKYGASNTVNDKILGATLTSIADKSREIEKIEEDISQILSRYPET